MAGNTDCSHSGLLHSLSDFQKVFTHKMFFVLIICMKNYFSHRSLVVCIFHAEHDYHAAKNATLTFFGSRLIFFQTSALQTNTSTSHDGYVEPYQHQHQWLLCSLSVTLCTQCCFTNKAKIMKAKIFRTTHGKV